MNYNAFVDSKTHRVNRHAVAAGTAGIASAARWFWWIAVLSLLNAVLIHTDTSRNFPLGLAFTSSFDHLFRTDRTAAWIIYAATSVAFVTLGWFAGRGEIWAFAVGSGLYVLDALQCLKLKAMLPLGFHLLVLVAILRGAMVLQAALTAAQSAADEGVDQDPT